MTIQTHYSRFMMAMLAYRRWYRGEIGQLKRWPGYIYQRLRLCCVSALVVPDGYRYARLHQPGQILIVYGQRRYMDAPGAMLLPRPTAPAMVRLGAIAPNQPVLVLGWIRAEQLVYPGNPRGAQGRHWLYVRSADGRCGWVVDAGIRMRRTRPARSSRPDPAIEPRCFLVSEYQSLELESAD